MGNIEVAELINNGIMINNGSISYKKLKLLETRKSYLTERRIASPSAKTKGGSVIN